MPRLTQSQPCPACGESMRVLRSHAVQKVCCPHCRQNVVLSSPHSLPPLSDGLSDLPENLDQAEERFGELLQTCKAKRQLLGDTEQEIQALDHQVRALGEWLHLRRAASEGTLPIRLVLELQARLFDQLRGIQKGRVVIQDCAAGAERSLADQFLLTFEALAWDVDFHRRPLPAVCGEEVTFVVPPGPVAYASAALHIALHSAGVRLHCQIDPDQSEETTLLRVHRISTLPKLLPKSEKPPLERDPDELKKTA